MAMDWKPIETAPRTGEDVLLWSPSCRLWSGDIQRGHATVGRWVDLEEGPGWQYSHASNSSLLSEIWPPPTHWAELPAQIPRDQDLLWTPG